MSVRSDDDEDEDIAARGAMNEMVKMTWLVQRNFDDALQPRKRFPCDTPVHVAVFENNLHVLQWLHTKGADFAATNLLGETPLQNACASVKPRVVAFVLETIALSNENPSTEF